MSLFNFWKKDASRYFTDAEKKQVLEAIQKAEQQTSGEIRVFVEAKCSYVNPVDRAGEIFFSLKMTETEQRNAVLVYLAMEDHQLALFADEGIYKAAGAEYWNGEAHQMLEAFKGAHFADGLVQVINDIGEALHQHFPFYKNVDRNELPDDIVFGH